MSLCSCLLSVDTHVSISLFIPLVCISFFSCMNIAMTDDDQTQSQGSTLQPEMQKDESRISEFINLRSLEIIRCSALVNLFPVLVSKHLEQLDFLKLYDRLHMKQVLQEKPETKGVLNVENHTKPTEKMKNAERNFIFVPIIQLYHVLHSLIFEILFPKADNSSTLLHLIKLFLRTFLSFPKLPETLVAIFFSKTSQ